MCVYVYRHRDGERREEEKLQRINRVDCGVSLMSHILARQVGFGFRIRVLERKRKELVGVGDKIGWRLSDSDR